VADISRRSLIKLLGAIGVSSTLIPQAFAEKRSMSGELSYAGGRAWLHPRGQTSSLEALMFDSGAHASTVWRNADRFVGRQLGEIEVASIGEAPHLGIKALIDHITVSDLVLGTAGFSNHTLSLNFAEGSYSVSNIGVSRDDYPGYYRANIFRFGQVYTRFYNSQINGRRARGILDTGSRITTLFPKLVERLDLLENAVELGPKTFVTGTTGKITTAQYVKVRRLDIADEIFENHWCVAVTDTDFKQHGSPEYLIGMDIASQFHIVWDLTGSKRVYLKRNNPKPPPPLQLLAGKKITSHAGQLWVYDDTDFLSAEIETVDDIFSRLNPLKIIQIPNVTFGQSSTAFQYARFRDSKETLKLMVDEGIQTKEIEIEQVFLA